MSALMIQGCGSDVGKSLLVAGLCRLFANRGMIVRPFKPQNMSNNAAVTADGGEIGRSTALQAIACRTAPTVDMNPVLLKPQSDIGAQLIVRGQRVGVLNASAHGNSKRELLAIAVECYRRLQSEADLVIVEGAGSPAETNLRAHDIANMGFAHAADLPVVLVGDINRGHVIASIVGAHAVLDAADRARIQGFIINKFRGDVRLFDAGLTTIESYTGWPSFGVVPWIRNARHLPEEDGMQLANGVTAASSAAKKILIAVLHLPHIANFDDFDPLLGEPAVDLRFVAADDELPLDADLIILPGSKTTIADLEFLRAHHRDEELRVYVRRGGRVLGICAGYQMLGRVVRDPQRIEGDRDSSRGLELLDMETVMTPQKVLRPVAGRHALNGAAFHGYEMHLGATSGAATSNPLLRFADGTAEGAVSTDGRVAGCHVHGLFTDTAFRAAFLAELGARSANEDYSGKVDAALDEIAAVLEGAVDVEGLLRVSSLALRAGEAKR